MKKPCYFMNIDSSGECLEDTPNLGRCEYLKKNGDWEHCPKGMQSVQYKMSVEQQKTKESIDYNNGFGKEWISIAENTYYLVVPNGFIVRYDSNKSTRVALTYIPSINK